MLAMDAELLWAQGQRGLAVQQVRSLVAALDAAVQGRRATDAELGRLHVQSSIRLAAWLSEEGSAALEEIRASLRAAVDAAKTGQPGSAPLRSEASFTFAQFADRQLGHILRQERSPEWQQRKLHVDLPLRPVAAPAFASRAATPPGAARPRVRRRAVQLAAGAARCAGESRA